MRSRFRLPRSRCSWPPDNHGPQTSTRATPKPASVAICAHPVTAGAAAWSSLAQAKTGRRGRPRPSSPDLSKGNAMIDHILEPDAQAFADATSRPPFLADLGVEGARKLLDEVQAAPIDKPDVADEWITVPAEVGDVR